MCISLTVNAWSNISASGEVCHPVSFPYDDGVPISSVVFFSFFVLEFPFPCVLATPSAKGMKKAQLHRPGSLGRRLELTSPWEDGRLPPEAISLYACDQLLVSTEHLAPTFLLCSQDRGSELPQFWEQLLPQQDDWEIQVELSRVPTSVDPPRALRLLLLQPQATLPGVQNSPVPPPYLGVLFPELSDLISAKGAWGHVSSHLVGNFQIILSTKKRCKKPFN